MTAACAAGYVFYTAGDDNDLDGSGEDGDDYHETEDDKPTKCLVKDIKNDMRLYFVSIS